MKIIKEGHPPQHKFLCEECGCEFIAEGKEFSSYARLDGWAGANYWVTVYSSKCPCCGEEARDVED